MLQLGELIAIMPRSAARAAPFVGPLNLTMRHFSIDTRPRVAAFLSQIAVESGELQFTREIWRPTEQQRKYEPPSSVAAGLGNTEPGDGYAFRGRGLIQLTGRDNYIHCGRSLGIDLVAMPQALEQPLLACLSAGWFWERRGINRAADRGDIDAVTRLVNGGVTALAERRAYYEQALKVLT